MRAVEPDVQRPRLVAQHDCRGTPEDHRSDLGVLVQNLLGGAAELVLGHRRWVIPRRRPGEQVCGRHKPGKPAAEHVPRNRLLR